MSIPFSSFLTVMAGFSAEDNLDKPLQTELTLMEPRLIVSQLLVIL